MRLMIPTSAEMERFGHRCGMVALAGDVVVLTGELGAGKTTFARGYGEALDLDTPVSSPTYIVARTHQRRDPSLPPLVHVDAYRLGSAAELDELDIDVEGSIVLAEWAGPYGETLASSWVEVSLRRPVGNSADLETDEPRDVTLQGYGPKSDLLERLAKASEEFHVFGG